MFITKQKINGIKIIPDLQEKWRFINYFFISQVLTLKTVAQNINFCKCKKVIGLSFFVNSIYFENDVHNWREY